MRYNDKNEIIDNMLKISTSIRDILSQEQKQIDSISYYKDFQFKGANLGIEGVFVVKIKDDTVPENEMNSREEDNLEEGITYEIYDEDNNLVCSVDEKGEIAFDLQYIEYLQERGEGYFDQLDLDAAEFELPDEQERDSITMKKDELEKLENDKKLEEISKLTGEQDIKSYSEASTKQQVELFDKVTNKQEINPNLKVTQTETLADMIPEIKEKGYVKIGIVYSNPGEGQTGRFSFVGITKDGEIGTIDSLENTEGTTTGQKVTSINSRDGSEVEEEQVAGMVRINGRKREGQEEFLSVKVGQYGILEADYVRAELSEEKGTRYLSGPIESQNQRPASREVREFMDRNRNVSMKDEIERAQPELERDEESQMENIDDTASNDRVGADDIIVLEDGSETTLRKEAMKDKVSVEDFVRRYNERGGDKAEEKIENIHDEYAEEYGEPTRNR